MALNHIDASIVDNLRRIYGYKLDMFSSEVIAKAWRNFSLSDEYPDKDETIFPLWCEAEMLEPL